MKGKAEAIQTQIQENRKYTLTLTVTLERGLTYEEGEKRAAKLKEKYLGKEVDLNLGPTFQRK